MKTMSRLVAAALFVVAGAFIAHADPIEISTAAEFATALAADPTGDYKLTADLDLTSWTSLDFSGKLDGAGHKISGLTVPLFGTVSGNAVIKDIEFNGVSVSESTAGVNIGVLAKSIVGAAFSISDIDFVGCTLYKKNGGHGGMVAGYIETSSSAEVKNCTIDATSEVKTAANSTWGVAAVAGGVVANGENAELTISGCSNFGKHTLQDWTVKGAGLIASVTAKKTKGTNNKAWVNIYDCTNHASVTFNGSNGNFGGIVCTAEGGTDGINGSIRFLRCVNYGDLAIKNAQSALGGIVSVMKNGGLIMSNCVNYGNITIATASKASGGLVGSIQAPIRETIRIANCANLGDISGNDAGGLVGEITHNSSFKTTKFMIDSCLQRGTLSARRVGGQPGEAIGFLTSAVAYPYVEVSGAMFNSDTLIGGAVVGGSITEEVAEDNVFATEAEGLVDGVGLATLNAFADGCNLWKQGTVSPILKIMPNEAAPDKVTARFKDAADFASVILKTSVISRGRTPVAPESPEHDGYTFTGWNPADFAELQQDTDIVATYQSGILEYRVRFFDYDGTQIGDDQTVEHGDPAIPPPDPVRADYLFTGWNKDFSSVTEEMDVTATYVKLVQDVSSGDGLAYVLTNAAIAEVTYRLTDDVVLTSAWNSVEFVAKLDGDGHTIHYAGTKPVFSRLTGSVSNLTLDGEVDEEPTSIHNVMGRFGMIAVDCPGGAIRNVRIRNYILQISNSANSLSIGGICGTAGDGAVIDGCTVESNCQLRVRSCTVGGIVGSSTMSDFWSGEDPRLLTVSSCTNEAEILTIFSGNASLAGIVADCSSGDKLRKPEIVISNCVNRGQISRVDTCSIDGRFAGIVANRNANIDSGVEAGSLTIVDCVNQADVNAQGTNGCHYAGIMAYTYRLGAISIIRCCNLGRIGSPIELGEVAATSGSAAGIFSTAADIYSPRPILISDCANYGDVYGVYGAGGLFGTASINADYSNLALTSTNCANYGSITASVGGEYIGQWIGRFESTTKRASTVTFGAWNCFFMNDHYVGAQGVGLPIHTNDNVTAVDPSYSSRSAKKALNAWAEANGYGAWVLGKVNGTVYPELAAFCAKPYVPGLVLIIR